MQDAEEICEILCKDPMLVNLSIETFFDIYNSITITNENLADYEKLHHYKISQTVVNNSN